MCDQRFDITYQDLNPTFLYAWKGNKQYADTYHCHDFTEMLYLVSGELSYLVEGKVLRAKQGDLMIINPNTDHRCTQTSENEPAVLFCTGFSDYHFKGMPPNEIHLKNGEILLHTDKQLQQRIGQLCQNMASENTLSQPGTYFMLKSYLIQMLLLIIREQIEPVEMKHHYEFKSFNKTYIVEQILTFLEKHYNEKISLDQIAQNMYLSPFYISKVFKSETGQTPIHYLIGIRMEKAKEYMEQNPGASIKETAVHAGYEDTYHFSKLFKKHFGTAPSHFRRSRTSS